MQQSGTTDVEASNELDCHPHGLRSVCDALRLFDLCPKAKCRRAGACRGASGPCLSRHSDAVPEEVWEWVDAVLAARDNGLGPEGMKIAGKPHKAAYFAWICGVIAGSRSRHLPK